MGDFIQGLDPSKLVLFETALSLLAAPFASPSYNLPLFLFGTLVQELPDVPQSLKTFIGCLGASVFFDVVWMIRHEQNAFIRAVTIIILIAKLPTWLAFANGMRQAGGSFGGLGVGGRDLGGATVWSMPGGFTSTNRGGYQNVDEPAAAPQTPKPPPSSVPPPSTQSAPGAYQNV